MMVDLQERRMRFLLILTVSIGIFFTFVDGFTSITAGQNVERKADRSALQRTCFPLFSKANEDLAHDYVLKQRNPYDVHVYYGTAEQKDAAMELREQMQTVFPWMRFYNPKDRPIGPHPLPMWEADFGAFENRDKWIVVRDFLLNNNPTNLSILIHPHSMDGDYADHTKNAYWVGDKLELRIRGWQ